MLVCVKRRQVSMPNVVDIEGKTPFNSKLIRGGERGRYSRWIEKGGKTTWSLFVVKREAIGRTRPDTGSGKRERGRRCRGV